MAERNYFIGGYTWGDGKNQVSKLNDFINHGIWENGWGNDGIHNKPFKNIKTGDLFALKSTFRKQKKSILKISKVGIVTDIFSDCKIAVEWFPDIEGFELELGKYRNTLIQIRDKTEIENIFGKALEIINQNNKMENEFTNLLLANKNLILTGAPGTGKTYLAKQIAEAMKAEWTFVQFHPSYDYTDFVEGLRPTPPDGNGNIGFRRQNGVFKEFCKIVLDNQHINIYNSIYNSIYQDIENGKIEKLHDYPVIIKDSKIGFNVSSNYSLTHLESMFKYFISKNCFDLSKLKKDDYNKIISDITENGTNSIDYTYYSALLQEMLNRTENRITDIHKPFVFIIDEINRGEISKIFGELFFSIDPSYRGIKGKVQTQYANLIEDGDIFKDGFYVPENVYIIGTMNDIDRSVESFDFAMRRRFTWKEITAEESQRMFENEDWKDEAIKRMDSLNKAISDIQGLGSAYHIGAAYFKNNLPKYTDNPLENVWNYHLKPLLFEYLRGMPDAETKLKELENAYNLKSNTIDNEQGTSN